jgi:Ulp1 family protease
LTLVSYHEMEVKIENYSCLSYKQLIDDVIVDFYLRYVFNEKLTEAQRKTTYIFKTFFYALYSVQPNFQAWKKSSLPAVEKRYSFVKDIPVDNVFNKDFLVVPLINNGHWLLAIVCYPREAQREHLNSRSMILIFDSIKHNSDRRKHLAVSRLQNYLESEWRAKYHDEFPFDKMALVGHIIECPQQTNRYDCGLFMMEFVERFFAQSPLQHLNTSLDLSQWFDAAIIKEKRKEIALVIYDLMVQGATDVNDLPRLPTLVLRRDTEVVAADEVIEIL